jgi:murein DD-endopeptidase MepM/ murein hydrolase activator NlpD
VVRGQTLYTIARTYGISLSALVQANDVEDPNRIEAGMLLFIPGAPETMEVPLTVGPGAPPTPDLRFLLPAAGPLNSGYGPRWGRMHYGVDIGAPAGSPVRAARDGVVLYAGSGYRGYGKLVILDHGSGYRTLYAHNQKLLARVGRSVRAGDIIGRVGSTGNATGPHLHFEIRRNDRPLDPGPYLQYGH